MVKMVSKRISEALYPGSELEGGVRAQASAMTFVNIGLFGHLFPSSFAGTSWSQMNPDHRHHSSMHHPITTPHLTSISSEHPLKAGQTPPSLVLGWGQSTVIHCKH